MVRGACVWAQVGDPLAGAERIRREDDSDAAALRAALGAWSEAFGKTPKTVAEVVSEALARAESDRSRDPSLRDALLGLTVRDKLDTRTVGYALRRVRGRIACGLRFEVAGTRHAGATTWAVVGTAEEMVGMEDMITTNAGANGGADETTEVGTAGNMYSMPTIPSHESVDRLDCTTTTPATSAEPRPEASALVSPCPNCRGTRFWRRLESAWLCRTCHPAPSEDVIAESWPPAGPKDAPDSPNGSGVGREPERAVGATVAAPGDAERTGPLRQYLNRAVHHPGGES
ncbi:MAG: hypothetical protein E6J45_14660 [Chloroflexi bacterium]|nr:MAG: hypothetical protein E6J45_14660 [Chloroflexota bacterium]